MSPPDIFLPGQTVNFHDRTGVDCAVGVGSVIDFLTATLGLGLVSASSSIIYTAWA